MNIDQTLQQIREVRKVTTYRHKKRKKQTKKDYYLHKANYTCAYCSKMKEKNDLSLIRKNHTLMHGQIYESENNRIVSCKKCASKKGTMDHLEFKKHLIEERRIKRKEMSKNYSRLSKRVFNKYENKCIYCEFEHGYTPAEAVLTIDHKDPIGQQGDNNEKNLASACKEHNNEKGNQTADDYFSYLERVGRKRSSKKILVQNT